MTTVHSPYVNTQTTQPRAENPSLNIQDLQNLLLVLDMAAQRGAFKAAELSQIGGVFDRVNSFVQGTIAATTPPTNPEPVMHESTLPAITQPVPNVPPFAPKIGV